MPASASTIRELRNRIQQIETSSTAGFCKAGKSGKVTTATQATSRFSEEEAFRKIERLACLREHASKALQARLVKDGFTEEVANAAVERAQRCGLVSNERFADVLVRSRISQGKGLQGIAAELTSFDIDPLSVPEYTQALDNTTGPDELARALALLETKPPRSKHPRQSAYRKLMQKGYGASVASSAARIWSEEHASATR